MGIIGGFFRLTFRMVVWAAGLLILLGGLSLLADKTSNRYLMAEEFDD